MMTLLNPPYSILRLAGIESDEKVEEKELKEGGGEDRVDSSESDEPKVDGRIKGRLEKPQSQYPTSPPSLVNGFR